MSTTTGPSRAPGRRTEIPRAGGPPAPDGRPGRWSRLRCWWLDSPRSWPASSLLTLFWLSFLCFHPLFAPAEQRSWFVVVTIAAVVVFVPVYLAAELRDGPMRDWSAELCTGLALLVLATGHAGGTILLAYAGGAVAERKPRRLAVLWFLGMTVVGLIAMSLSTIPSPWWAVAYLPGIVMIWATGLLILESRDASRTEQLRAVQAEQLVVLAERERISRDLHDVLGHHLTAIVVRAQLARRLTEVDPAAGSAEMAEVERAARDALAEVRATVAGFRQAELATELSGAQATLAAAGVRCVVDCAVPPPPNPTAEAAVAMALREAVTNVARHARASHATITTTHHDGRFTLVVADNGVGGGRDGAGLTGMRERVVALGGRVDRSARPGTTVTVDMPVPTGHGDQS